jgi:hypothetical protein
MSYPLADPLWTVIVQEISRTGVMLAFTQIAANHLNGTLGRVAGRCGDWSRLAQLGGSRPMRTIEAFRIHHPAQVPAAPPDRPTAPDRSGEPASHPVNGL